MAGRRKSRKTPSRVSRGGITAIKIGKDDVFIFKGRKLKKGTMGVFASKGQLRLGMFQANSKKKSSSKRTLKKGKRKSSHKPRSLR